MQSVRQVWIQNSIFPKFSKCIQARHSCLDPPLFERFKEVLVKKRRKGLTANSCMWIPIGFPLDPDLQNLDQRFNDRSRHSRLLCSFASCFTHLLLCRFCDVKGRTLAPCNPVLGHIKPCSAHDLWRRIRKTQVRRNKRYGTFWGRIQCIQSLRMLGG